MARAPARKTSPPDDDDKAPRYSHRYCNARATQPRVFGPGLSADRVRAINSIGDKWVNGTELSYYFFDKATDGETVTAVDGTTQFVGWRGSNAE
jgi:hypothetical protein